MSIGIPSWFGAGAHRGRPSTARSVHKAGADSASRPDKTISRGQCLRLVVPPSLPLPKLRPASLVDLFWEFAVAETQNDERHDRLYSQGLGANLLTRVRANERASITPREWQRVRSTVLGTRPVYLPLLLSLRLRWNTGWVKTAKLAEFRVPRLNIFLPTAPSRKLSDFAAALERGAQPGNNFVAHYQRLKRTFQAEKMVGAPVVLCEAESGPFTIVEGLTRLSVLCSRFSSGDEVPPRVRLLIGKGRAAAKWPFY